MSESNKKGEDMSIKKRLAKIEKRAPRKERREPHRQKRARRVSALDLLVMEREMEREGLPEAEREEKRAAYNREWEMQNGAN